MDAFEIGTFEKMLRERAPKSHEFLREIQGALVALVIFEPAEGTNTPDAGVKYPPAVEPSARP